MFVKVSFLWWKEKRETVKKTTHVQTEQMHEVKYKWALTSLQIIGEVKNTSIKKRRNSFSNQ